MNKTKEYSNCSYAVGVVEFEGDKLHYKGTYVRSNTPDGWSIY